MYLMVEFLLLLFPVDFHDLDVGVKHLVFFLHTFQLGIDECSFVVLGLVFSL